MAGSQDPWRISGEERSKHDIQFFQLKPVNGFVTGTQARDFFLQSGLPTQVLGQIWTLADINGDGKMDKKEFSIAMHLIKKKLQGYELPKVLPPSLKADPAPVVGSFAQPAVGNIPMAQPAVGNIPMAQPMGMGFSMGGVQTPVGHLIQPQASLGTATMTTGSLGLGPLMSNGLSGGFSHGGMVPVPMATVPGGAVLQSGGSIWAIPPAAKMKHTQSFNMSDRNKKGYLLGVEARAILMQSGLPQPVLAQIWSLSDIDRDGKLTCDEFCIAMHLTELARMGQVLPAALPPELMPVKSMPGSVISNPPTAIVPGPQKDAFGDLLGSVGMPLPVAAAPAPQQAVIEDDEQVTFEDKRKENFDKGQAELERRRAILREQQQKEENERLEKERQEAEKRERQRQEVEGRRQAELQKQLEKQKEREREIEEQRRKVLEQREAARRELERQRQMEWEKQRKEQLLVEKEREAEQIRMIKSQMNNLRNELETLEAKKAELALKVSQARKGVTDFTASIDSMRMTRDKTLAEIDAFERQTLVLTGKLSGLENEKTGLNNQMQSAQTTPLSGAHRTIANSVELKKSSIQKLKKELEKIETETEVKLREIDGSNTELKNLKEQLIQLERGLPDFQKQHEDKTQPQRKVAEVSHQSRKKEKEFTSAPAVPSSNPTSNGQPNWFDFNSSDAFSSTTVGVTNPTASWDTAFSGTSNSVTNNNTFASWEAGGPTAGGIQNKQKYRALYDFPAGREDELTLVAGMEVWVLTDFTPIPGMEDWYKGEHDGKMGWFPKSYVERLDEPSTDLFGGAFESLVQSSNVQTTETAKTDIFNSQLTQSSAASSAPAVSSADVSVPSDIPPEGLLAKAIYPWKARQETDLTFDKDDIILVKQQDDMKWFGELNGKSGWFPKAYVKLTGAAPKPKPEVNNDGVSQDKPSEPSTVPADGQGEYYSAMYTYTSDEPADLTFNEGDIIFVTSTAGDWWSGTIADQNKSGIFPASYVKKLEIQPSKPGVSGHIDSSFDSLLGDFGSVFPPASAKTSSKSSMGDKLASSVGAHPRSGVAGALGKDGAAGFFSAISSMAEISAAALNSDTKLDESFSPSMSLDSFGIIEFATHNSAVATTQHKEDILSGFDQITSDKPSLGVSDDMLDLSLNASIQSSHAVASGSDTVGYNIDGSQSQSIISGELFIGEDPFGNVLSNPWKENSKMETKDKKAASLGFSDGATDDLDWSFGAFEKPSASMPASSDFSLLDDFGLNSNSNLSQPAIGNTTSQRLDIMDDFGFGTPSASATNLKGSFKHSMSLPDILAMEDDAIQDDLREAQSTADILKSIEIPMSASRTSSVVQVDLDQKKSKLGSKPAPIPPALTPSLPTPSGPHFRSVAKTLFGRIKKKTPEQKSVKKPEIARVIAPYVATGTGQLSLEVGNLINVRQKSPRGWWEGELQVRGQKKKTGWFPANYVKLLSSTSARSTPEPTAAAALSLSDQGFRSATPQGTSSQDFSITQPDTVVALYPYVAQNDDELTFQKDDVITVLNRDNPSWWSGQVNGHTGMFPTNYVTPAQQS